MGGNNRQGPHNNNNYDSRGDYQDQEGGRGQNSRGRGGYRYTQADHQQSETGYARVPYSNSQANYEQQQVRGRGTGRGVPRFPPPSPQGYHPTHQKQGANRYRENQDDQGYSPQFRHNQRGRGPRNQNSYEDEDGKIRDRDRKNQYQERAPNRDRYADSGRNQANQNGNQHRYNQQREKYQGNLNYGERGNQNINQRRSPQDRDDSQNRTGYRGNQYRGHQERGQSHINQEQGKFRDGRRGRGGRTREDQSRQILRGRGRGNGNGRFNNDNNAQLREKERLKKFGVVKPIEGKIQQPQFIKQEPSEPIQSASEESFIQSQGSVQQVASESVEGDESVQGQEQPESDEGKESNESKQIEDQPLNLVGTLIVQEDDDSLKCIDTMVSQQQFKERLQTFLINNRSGTGLVLDTGRSFSIFEIDKRSMRPSLRLTLKRYRRSTNRSDENNQDESADLPRSGKALIEAMNYIQKEIMDSDNASPNDLLFPLPPGDSSIEFLHIYDFMWNRMRQMIKDVSRLTIEERMSEGIVHVCEQMLRFFIIAVHEGRKKNNTRLEFDQKMNLESITKILTQLLETYGSVRLGLQKIEIDREIKEIRGEQALQRYLKNKGIYISENEPEIVSYAIIISSDIQNTLNEKLMISQSGKFLEHPLLMREQVRRGIQIKKAMRNRDYQKFYKILQDPKTDYLLASLMLHHLHNLRKDTARVIYKGTMPFGKVRKVQYDFCRDAFRFKQGQDEQFEQFLMLMGGGVADQSMDGETKWVILNPNQQQGEQTYTIPQYIFDSNKMIRERYTQDTCKKKVVNKKIMSRQQLTKRSWFQKGYRSDVLRYYFPHIEKKLEIESLIPAGTQPSKNKQIIAQAKVFQKIEKSENITGSDAVIDEKADKIKKDKLDFLALKKHQMKRGRFLKGVQKLVKELIRSSDIHSQHKKKKGLQIIFQLVSHMRMVALFEAFQQLQIYKSNSDLARKTIQLLQKYKQMHDDFTDSLNQEPFQFKEVNKNISDFTMSELLKDSKRKQKGNSHSLSGLLGQSFDLYLKIVENETNQQKQLKRKMKIMVVFSSLANQPLGPKQIHFLQIFYAYCCRLDPRQVSQQYDSIRNLACLSAHQPVSNNWVVFSKKAIFEQGLRFQLNYELKFVHYRPNNQYFRMPLSSGYDSIIFLNLDHNFPIIEEIIQGMEHVKNQIFAKVKGVVSSSEPLALKLLIINLESFEHESQVRSKNELNIKSEYSECWYLLQGQLPKISMGLRTSCQSFIANVILHRESQFGKSGYLDLDRQLEIYNFQILLGEIWSNVTLIPSQILQINESKPCNLQQLQQYFNCCLDVLEKAVSKTFLLYEFIDWTQILSESAYFRRNSKNYYSFELDEQNIIYVEDEDLNESRLLWEHINFVFALLTDLRLDLVSSFQQVGKKIDSGFFTSQKELKMRATLKIRIALESYLTKFSVGGAIGPATTCVIDNELPALIKLQFSGSRIVGKCELLFQFIINHLKNNLGHHNLILSKGFLFSLNETVFKNKLKNKINSENTTEAEVSHPVIELLQQKYAEKRKMDDFHYARGEELKNLKRKLEAIQPLGINGRRIRAYD